MPLHIEPALCEVIPPGVATIWPLMTGGTYFVVIMTKDPRFGANGWEPVVQMLETQWRRKREEEEHHRYRDYPMGGMLWFGGRYRLYHEVLAADGGAGPARRCSIRGRNEFPDFWPHTDPLRALSPVLAFVRSLRRISPPGDGSQGEGESDLEAGDRFEGREMSQLSSLILGQRAALGYFCEHCLGSLASGP